jgi:hypothetical protein
MKTFRHSLLFGAIVSASLVSAHADSISVGSFASGTTAASLGYSSSQTAMNFAGFTPFSSPPAVGSTPTLQDGIANTYALSPNGVWANPVGNSSWIGSAPGTGPGGTNPAWGYYQYDTTFTAAGGVYSGTFFLMADDTVEVLLNGSVVVPFGGLGSDAECADNEVSCTVVDNIPYSGITLLSGTNTLTFIVEQAGILTTPGQDPSGMDFVATAASAIAPEPDSLILLGTGLITAAGFYLRRRPTL